MCAINSSYFYPVAFESGVYQQTMPCHMKVILFDVCQ